MIFILKQNKLNTIPSKEEMLKVTEGVTHLNQVIISKQNHLKSVHICFDSITKLGDFSLRMTLKFEFHAYIGVMREVLQSLV